MRLVSILSFPSAGAGTSGNGWTHGSQSRAAGLCLTSGVLNQALADGVREMCLLSRGSGEGAPQKGHESGKQDRSLEAPEEAGLSWAAVPGSGRVSVLQDVRRAVATHPWGVSWQLPVPPSPCPGQTGGASLDLGVAVPGCP